jgi:hypothetical protein
MAESEKNIHEILTKLAAHLEAIERKVDLTTADLGKVREKVDLTMSSISVVQEEQVQVHKRLQTMSATTGACLGDGIMGPAPSSTSTASTAASSAPPPIPSDRLLRNPQVTLTNPPPRTQISEGVQGDGDRGDGMRPWLLKMEFPHFDGSDAQIWIDKCSSYFTLYQIPQSFRVSAASLHMLGAAAH